MNFDRKINQLVEDEQAIRGSVENYFFREHQKHEEEVRKESIYNSQQSQYTQQTLHGDIESLNNSNRVAYELREMAIGVVTALREQNFTLKRAKRRLLDISNTLGLSHTLMRVIERRNVQDQIIVYSLMVFVLVLFGLLVYYFRW